MTAVDTSQKGQTMADPFATPSSIPSEDYFKPKDHVDALILFKPTGTDPAYTYGGMAKKPVETTIADVVVIDVEDVSRSTEYEAAHISPYGIRKSLDPAINQKLVLARLRKKPDPSETVSGAYFLADPTDDEKDIALRYLASKAPQL